MSYMKRYFEDHIEDFSDEELLSYGYSEKEIQEFRESFKSKRV